MDTSATRISQPAISQEERHLLIKLNQICENIFGKQEQRPKLKFFYGMLVIMPYLIWKIYIEGRLYLHQYAHYANRNLRLSNIPCCFVLGHHYYGVNILSRQFNLVAMTLWCIWKDRNNAIFRKMPQKVAKTKFWCSQD